MAEQQLEIVARAMDIIEKIAFAEGRISIRDIARQTGYSKSSIHRIIRTLTAKGFICKSPGESYALGARFLVLKSVKSIYESYVEIMAPIAAEVVAATRQTALANVLDGDGGMCIFKLEPPTAVKFVTEVGMAIPIDAGASGKILLAYAPEEVRERVYAKPPVRYARNTILDRDALRRHIGEIRTNRLAVSREEFQENSFSVSVPIFLPTGQFLSQYGIAGAVSMLDGNEEFFVGEVRRSAQKIHDALAASGKFQHW